ncbi:MAG: signal recognition particle protein [Lentisphaerae bacterium GWF2_57_35]|nr:MAG: signal recognition particle protein [Lentisphaerae bacterium GWF2_57_35]
MFDKLSSSLQKVFKNLRGYGKLSESNIQDALREVRMALLEADVHFQVAKDFVARVKEKCLGKEVLESITPGQQVIKIVNDELVALLGSNRKDFDLSGRPVGIMMLGLHGSGKTTSTGKLARRWKKDGKHVVLAACDIRRPAAVDQLRILAGQAGVDFVAPEPNESVPALGKRALSWASHIGADFIIYDTGGRFQLDTELVGELKELRDAARPRNVVLVLDAAIGQESVHVAETFHKEVGLTGLILTKLDGDARGGAALSVQSVTGCPILMTGVGERQEDFEPFYPERMASRILGMGDIVSLVEKAQQSIDIEEMARVEERLKKDTLDLEDFLIQLQQMKKLGPLENLLEMLPGGANVPAHAKAQLAGASGDTFKKSEAIIQSMTPRERRRPDIIDASRRRRIAQGSGTAVSDVNELLKNFERAKKMTQQLKKAQKRLLRFGK